MRAIIAAMDGMLQPPSVTVFDAAASLVSLAVYVGAAILMLARRPRDSAARVFLVIALTSAVPYMLSAAQWWKGAGVYRPWTIALTAAAFSVGSTALFHFAQVFPWRRPWITAHGRWLIAAYVVPTVSVGAAAWVLTGILSQMQADAPPDQFAIASTAVPLVQWLVVMAALPAIFVVGVVFPLVGVTSLAFSWREAKARANEPARITAFWMLISQMGGGVLAVLVIPLLHVIGVSAPWPTIFGVLVYGFALIMPIAYINTSVP